MHAGGVGLIPTHIQLSKPVRPREGGHSHCRKPFLHAADFLAALVKAVQYLKQHVAARLLFARRLDGPPGAWIMEHACAKQRGGGRI